VRTIFGVDEGSHQWRRDGTVGLEPAAIFKRELASRLPTPDKEGPLGGGPADDPCPDERSSGAPGGEALVRSSCDGRRRRRRIIQALV
jgi:hypothetical protein